MGIKLTYPVASRIKRMPKVRLVVKRLLRPALVCVFVFFVIVAAVAHIAISVAVRLVSIDGDLSGLVTHVAAVTVDVTARRRSVQLVARVIPEHTPVNDAVVACSKVVDSRLCPDIPHCDSLFFEFAREDICASR